ncbi:hypothetical protein RA210_U130003 [Rubrivivax sp. A210]|uniref:fibronectin type III domain-containing protein n=1 Tax=Rubrivivax sp. A210 TaxID=2772301 RepID=UPI001919130F|nr:fibronectin type III domain-containing protein [Rubrivivax sp. A210]CAD5370507.1 hypothetical protein RA210_U130003 [Rubrivivax sp. A210]
MKLLQKAKYISIGSVAALAVVSLSLRASDAIPLIFKKGDVLSANVMNALFARVNDATSPIVASDLVGTWLVTQVVPFNGQPGNGNCRVNSSCTMTGLADAADQMSRSRTDTVTFSIDGTALVYSQARLGSFVGALPNAPEAGTASVIAETAIFSGNLGDGVIAFQYFYAKKKSATRIVLQDIQSASGAFNILVLDKLNIPPSPVATVSVAASGASAMLTWSSSHADQTGYSVQRTSDNGVTWVNVKDIPDSAARSFVDSDLATGDYQYQIFATNGHGKSIGSSVVPVTIK